MFMMYTRSLSNHNKMLIIYHFIILHFQFCTNRLSFLYKLVLLVLKTTTMYLFTPNYDLLHSSINLYNIFYICISFFIIDSFCKFFLILMTSNTTQSERISEAKQVLFFYAFVVCSEFGHKNNLFFTSFEQNISSRYLRLVLNRS